MFDIHLSQRAVYTLSTLLALILPLQGLFFAVLTDNYFEKKQKWNYLVLIFLVLCLAAQNYAPAAARHLFHIERLKARKQGADFSLLPVCMVRVLRFRRCII